MIFTRVNLFFYAIIKIATQILIIVLDKDPEKSHMLAYSEVAWPKTLEIQELVNFLSNSVFFFSGLLNNQINVPFNGYLTPSDQSYSSLPSTGSNPFTFI